MKKRITIKRAVIILGILAIIGIFAVVGALRSKSNTEYITSKAEKANIIQTVSETGTVKSANELNLSFLNSGKINKIIANVGDKVKKDQILAELDYTASELSRKEAKANLDVAVSSLEKLKAGATSEDIAIARTSAQQAKTTYDSAVKELSETRTTVNESISQAQKRLSDLQSKTPQDVTTYEQAVATAQTNFNNAQYTYSNALDNSRESALTTMDDKISKAIAALDTINTTLDYDDAENLLSVQDTSFLTNANSTYKEAQNLITTAQSSLSNAKIKLTKEYILKALSDSALAINKTFDSLQYTFKALEKSIISSEFAQTELDTLKSNISAQQTVIGTAKTSLDSAKQAYNTALLSYDTNVNSAQESLNQANTAYNNAIIEAQNSYNTAKLSGTQQITAAESKVSSTLKSWQVTEAQLSKTNAPANTYDLSLSEAKVRQAQANLESANKLIENSIIKAPIDGTVTKVNFKSGEQISQTQPIISMLGVNNFEIEVLISEADIAKIKLNDPAEVSLDAFGDDKKFKGIVYFIEPAETVISDVIYYKVKVEFEPGAEQVRSGMTANVTIVTAQKDNILVAPQRAVLDKNGQGKFIRILNGKDLQEIKVELGLSGDEGIVEVVSGINEGDTIVTSIKQK